MLILLLVLAPFGTGLIINRDIDEENRGLGVTYVAGFLTLLAAFQLIQSTYQILQFHLETTD